MRTTLKVIFITGIVFVMMFLNAMMQVMHMGGALPMCIVLFGGVAAIRAIYKYNPEASKINQTDIEKTTLSKEG